MVSSPVDAAFRAKARLPAGSTRSSLSATSSSVGTDRPAASAMQAAQACEKPVLVRVETQGSHGYLPTDKRIAELADLWAFAAQNTGMKNTMVP